MNNNLVSILVSCVIAASLVVSAALAGPSQLVVTCQIPCPQVDSAVLSRLIPKELAFTNKKHEPIDGLTIQINCLPIVDSADVRFDTSCADANYFLISFSNGVYSILALYTKQDHSIQLSWRSPQLFGRSAVFELKDLNLDSRLDLIVSFQYSVHAFENMYLFSFQHGRLLSFLPGQELAETSPLIGDIELQTNPAGTRVTVISPTHDKEVVYSIARKAFKTALVSQRRLNPESKR